LITATDYSPFGAPIKQWYANDDTSGYKFGFNGKENDKETGLQDYGFRIYNPALGKFLSVDPLCAEYPWNSTYAFAENRVLDGIDLDGQEWTKVEGGFMWDPANAYVNQSRTKLKAGYYTQAIYFTD